MCALGAGLSVGREGPLVHVSACLAEALMRAPPFRAAVHAVPALRAQVLAVAGALGVASTFTTPISAIFFSIEVRGCERERGSSSGPKPFAPDRSSRRTSHRALSLSRPL